MASESAGEYITVTEAREMLGVSKPKMAKLLKPRGPLDWKPNPVDLRGKILLRSDVEAFMAKLPKKDVRAAA
jgi:hypothetical protein